VEERDKVKKILDGLTRYAEEREKKRREEEREKRFEGLSSFSWRPRGYEDDDFVENVGIEYDERYGDVLEITERARERIYKKRDEIVKTMSENSDLFKSLQYLLEMKSEYDNLSHLFFEEFRRRSVPINTLSVVLNELGQVIFRTREYISKSCSCASPFGGGRYYVEPEDLRMDRLNVDLLIEHSKKKVNENRIRKGLKPI